MAIKRSAVGKCVVTSRMVSAVCQNPLISQQANRITHHSHHMHHLTDLIDVHISQADCEWKHDVLKVAATASIPDKSKERAQMYTYIPSLNQRSPWFGAAHSCFSDLQDETVGPVTTKGHPRARLQIGACHKTIRTTKVRTQTAGSIPVAEQLGTCMRLAMQGHLSRAMPLSMLGAGRNASTELW